MRHALLALSLVACGLMPATARATTAPAVKPLSEDEVTALAERANRATYEIVYTVNGKLNGDAVGGEWTTFQRPPLARLDMTLGGKGFSFAIRSYVTPDGVISCDLGTRTCQEVDPKDPALALQAGPLDGALRARPADFIVTFVRKDRIAAADVDCLRVRPRTAGVAAFREATLCYTNDGLPAFMELELKDGKLTLEAMGLKRTVADADVLPPY